jgi:acyl carrier protein
MSDEEIELLVRQTLAQTVPAAERASLVHNVPFAEQLPFDSVDLLDFVLDLGATIGREIPQTDYIQMSTLGGCIAYLKRLGLRVQPTAA